MKVYLFESEDDQQTVWEKELDNGNQLFSSAVVVEDEVLDMKTLFVREEKSLIWLKAPSEGSLTTVANQVMSNIKKGLIKPYRAFYTEPVYDGHEEDINPETEEGLGRWSQIKLCATEDHPRLHRQFVDVDDEVEEEIEEPVAPAVVAKEEVKLRNGKKK